MDNTRHVKSHQSSMKELVHDWKCSIVVDIIEGETNAYSKTGL